MAVNWDRIWRMSGITSVVLFVIAWAIYGDQPKVGASPASLVSFYDGDRTRILIAIIILGQAVLNLVWFAAAISTVLRDAGQGGWATAATAASAAVGSAFFALMTVVGALAYSVAGSGNDALTSGLNDLTWALIVVSSSPRAMLIMAVSFGLWRAGKISNVIFGAGVAALVLVLLGSTTWASSGIWAPDGAYSQFISPIIGLVWTVVIRGVLLSRTAPSTVRAPEPAPAMNW
jgi:hypothetical protein